MVCHLKYNFFHDILSELSFCVSVEPCENLLSQDLQSVL